MSKQRKNRNGLTKPKRADEDIPREPVQPWGASLYGAVSLPSDGLSRYAQQVLRDQPVAYWRLQEASGSFSDLVVGNTAVPTLPDPGITYGVTNGVSLGNAKGIALAGQKAAAFTALSIGTTCSFELWFKPSVSAVHYAGLLGNGGGGVSFYFAHDLVKFLVFAGADKTNTTTLTVGTLYHCVVSIAGGSGTFYINGVADGTFTGWAGNSFNALLALSGAGVSGTLSEVALYSAALSVQQAKDHYNLGVGSK